MGGIGSILVGTGHLGRRKGELVQFWWVPDTWATERGTWGSISGVGFFRGGSTKHTHDTTHITDGPVPRGDVHCSVQHAHPHMLHAYGRWRGRVAWSWTWSTRL